MMTCERGYYVRMGKLDSPEAEHSADHYFDLRENKSKKKEKIAEEQASVEYLDYRQVGEYISKFYNAGNNADRKFYRDKIVEINKVYGPWLDEYTKKRMVGVLKAR